MSVIVSPIVEKITVTVNPITDVINVSITKIAVGIPRGGTDGQVLAKASDINYDLEWVDQQSGPVENANWGDIDGTLSDQTDLQAALDNKVDKVTGKGLSTEDYTTLEKTKLSGIAAGATANQTDAFLLARANHTGTQDAATITGSKTAAFISDFDTEVGNNTDVAANTAARHTHNNFSLLQTITEAFTTGLKTLYDAASAWIVTNGTNVLNHLASTSNPHSVTASQVGLGNVDNTSDATKNSATATLTNKTLTAPVIISPTGIVKGDVGLGNVDNTSDANKPVSTAQQTALDLKRSFARTTNGNSDYSIPSSTRVAATSAAFTAPRVWTLPAASSVPAGEAIEVSDAFGGVTSTNTLTIQRAGSDTINGGTSLVIAAAYAARRLVSNGSNGWAFDAGVLRASNNLSDLASAATSRTNLGVAASPVWVDYSISSTVVGWSSFTTKNIRYSVNGKTVTVNYYIDGTSDSSAITFTVPTAIGASGVTPLQGLTYAQNNGAPAIAQFSLSGSTVTLSRFNAIGATTTWTASGSKRAAGSFTYEID